MKKILLLFSILLFTTSQNVFADTVFKAGDKDITFIEDELKFYENGKKLSKDDVQKLFPDYEIITIKQFDKNKKYTLKNKPFKQRNILLLNDTPRTFHLFYIYPESARVKYNDLKEGEIKSLLLIRGKKNVRLKHFGGDEFEIVVR